MNDPATEPAPGLLVFADDWGRHPSSCQYLIRHLLPRHPVIWVNTIGTRRPSLDLATLRRGGEKLRHWLRPTRQPSGPSNLRVLNPWMWPMFSSRFDRWLNQSLLVRQLRPVLQSHAAAFTAVTTLPIMSGLIGRLPVKRWVYYCVDDFSTWPGLDQGAMRDMESDLAAKADVLIAASETLRDKLRQTGREVQLLTHGVEPEFWQLNGQPVIVPELEKLSRPLITFWGLVDRRMDASFVRRLAGDLEQGTIALVGPEGDADPDLLKLPRVVRIPALALEQLPHVANESSVLIMPYTDEPVTRAMQPLKLLEYLVTGKPVVVRELPATRAWADCLDLADSPAAFSKAVRDRLGTGLPEAQLRARARVGDESWEKKAKLFAGWVFGQGATP